MPVIPLAKREAKIGYFHSLKAMKYYVGYSLDPWKRVIEHNASIHIAFTSKHRPWELVTVFMIGNSENENVG